MNATLDFTARIHKVGRITVAICLVCFIALPIVLSAIFKVPIDYGITLQNGLSIFITFVLAAVCENIAYAPIIGPGALYTSCVTGDLSNMKVPAAINAMQITKVESGSEKGNIISILAVSTCTIVTTGLAFLGMIYRAPLIEPIFNHPVINPAFSNLLPALFGTLIVQQLVKSPKSSLPIFILPIIVVLIVGPDTFRTIQGFLIIGVGLIAIGYSYLLNRKEIVAANVAGKDKK
jgi:hypothetical protein